MLLYSFNIRKVNKETNLRQDAELVAEAEEIS